ncbi:peptide antibiotic transporter SbmA [Acinetobacter sp. HY1485]|uniref:peptide antibiotic transporter SbmA n=1 Tax=Acinetobacter sp. HY1485 TaxID=2970918 RepID=UPI0022B99677|nr:peptide antibiotic transporter SbmA [Acinetobacter sp. HY1485]
MFKSFFPSSRFFLWSVLIWIIFNMGLWYLGGETWGIYFGLEPNYFKQELAIGISRFWSAQFLWFYAWFIVAVGLFAGFWRIFSDNKWQNWSILGSALIIFSIWFNVQIDVAITDWYGPFWDTVQAMLNPKGGDIQLLYSGIVGFFSVAMLYIVVAVFTSFFTSHYVFRWRIAMTEYYTENWSQLRHIEGASQRVQEDTMRFATVVEDLGVGFMQAILTLVAFLPLLFQFSKHVPILPIIGEIPHALVWAALGWSLFGTILLVVVGQKLPGLQFNNQRVEAAYRKELVLGEDQPNRAQPVTLEELFSNVRKNYFKLYFHYTYFNLVSRLYGQIDVVFSLIILFPAIAAGLITLGLFNQIRKIFTQVSGSFQYLVSSWKTIIELLSIRKRLKAFEDVIN